MALSDLVIQTMEEGRRQVVALNDPEVIEQAKNIAYYAAMIDAGNDAPLDDPQDHAEAIAYLQTKMNEHVETYQRLTNNLLP